MTAGLISLIVALALVGFLLWLLTTYVPMPEPYRRAVVILVVLIVVLWVIGQYWPTAFTTRLP